MPSTGTRSTEPVPGQEGAAPHDLPQRRRSVGGRQDREHAGTLTWACPLPRAALRKGAGQNGVSRPAARMGFTDSSKLRHTQAPPHLATHLSV